jgi:hypothetical protein
VINGASELHAEHSRGWLFVNSKKMPCVLTIRSSQTMLTLNYDATADLAYPISALGATAWGQVQELQSE